MCAEKLSEISLSTLYENLLTDLTSAHFNDAVTEDMKEYVAGNKPYVLAAAVVGVTGLKQILLNSILRLTGRKLTLFNTIDQARDWLVEQ